MKKMLENILDQKKYKYQIYYRTKEIKKLEEKIIKIVSAKLRKFGSEPINQEKLVEIRNAVYSATKTNKFASFSNIKKWVKAARSAMKKEEADELKKKVEEAGGKITLK